MIDYNEVEKYLQDHDVSGSMMYIGCDSEALGMVGRGKLKASYTTVLVIHLKQKHGCKIFYDIEQKIIHARDRKEAVAARLREEYLLAGKIAQNIGIPLAIEYDMEIEIHLDLNPDPACKSSVVVNEAVGFIRGTCNMTPKIKPDAPIASTCADMFRAKLAWVRPKAA